MATNKMTTCIDIFLGSSIIEMRDERDKITILITNLNARLAKRNINVVLHICEQSDFLIKDKSSQEIINDDVKNSDYSIFIVGKKLGDATKNEFDIALEHFSEYKKPNITVLFKNCNCVEDEKVIELKNYLSNELKYYYKEYTNSDEITQYVTLLINDYCDNIFESRNDGIYLDGEIVQDYKNISSISNNKEIQGLEEELKKLNLSLESNPDDSDIKEKINEKIGKINKLKEKLGAMYLSMNESISLENTDEYSKAKIEFENGNINTALGIIEDNKDNRHVISIGNISDIQNKVIKKAEALIKENELYISLKGLDKVNNDDIKKAYQENIELERMAGLEPENEYLYGNYLFGILDYSGAFDHIFNYLLYQYKYSLKSTDKLHNLAKAYLRLGTIYSHLFQFEDAKFCYVKSANIHEEIAKQNNMYIFERANSYNKIGNVCDDLKDYENGEFYHNRAIKIYENILDNPEAIYELGYSYNKQGNIFRHKAIDTKNNDFFKEALECYNKNNELILNNDNILKKDQILGVNEKSIGLTYYAMKDYEEAIKHYDKSLEYFKSLFEKKVSSAQFQYAKVLFHKAESLYLLDSEEYEDDIIIGLKDNQKILEELTDKKINLREVLFELQRSNELLYKLKQKDKYLDKTKEYEKKLDDFKKDNQVYSISKGL